MKKLLSMIAIGAMITTFWACGSDDEGTPDGPTVTAPTGTTNIQIGTSADVSFSVSMPGGFKAAAISTVGGTASITSQPTAGSTSGTVIVNYSATTPVEAGSVTLNVTDNNNKTGSQTAVINKIADPVAPIVVVAGQILSNTTWDADNIYELAGRVIVTDGVTLTIEAGTVIKGREGEGANASALMIARGGKLNAMGTLTNPIIMTSVLDDIQPGEASGTTLDENDKGLWGGLVILGKAPVSVSGATEAQIEGVPAGESLGLYGGDAADDNSGTITFVSIRHGGTVLTGGSEINGLTLGGVGSGTTISNIEIFANVDDGVEFFGGSVNVTNILVTYQGDDAIDVDQAYSGTIDGFMVIQGGDTDEGLEIDGPEGTANATGKFIIKNGTLVADGSDAPSLGDFKSKAQGTVENVKWQGYKAGKTIKIAASTNNGTDCNDSGNAYTHLVSGDLDFNTVQFTGFGAVAYDASSTGCDMATRTTTVQGLITSETATGGPATSTWSWTLTANKSLF